MLLSFSLFRTAQRQHQWQISVIIQMNSSTLNKIISINQIMQVIRKEKEKHFHSDSECTGNHKWKGNNSSIALFFSNKGKWNSDLDKPFRYCCCNGTNYCKLLNFKNSSINFRNIFWCIVILFTRRFTRPVHLYFLNYLKLIKWMIFYDWLVNF